MAQRKAIAATFFVMACERIFFFLKFPKAMAACSRIFEFDFLFSLVPPFQISRTILAVPFFRSKFSRLIQIKRCDGNLSLAGCRQLGRNQVGKMIVTI